MGTSATPRTPSTAAAALVRGMTRLSAATLVVVMLYFLTGSLHYLIDYSPESYDRFWPKQPWIQLHLVSGLVATLAGPVQFWTGLRARSLAAHRWIGRAYVTSIALGGAAGLRLAVTASGGPARHAALITLAAAWWITTGMAYFAISRRAIGQHKEWMIRSYAVTLGGFGFSRLLERITVWALPGIVQDMDYLLDVDAGILWLSFVAPLMLVEVVLQGRKIVASRAVRAS